MERRTPRSPFFVVPPRRPAATRRTPETPAPRCATAQLGLLALDLGRASRRRAGSRRSGRSRTRRRRSVPSRSSPSTTPVVSKTTLPALRRSTTARAQTNRAVAWRSLRAAPAAVRFRRSARRKSRRAERSVAERTPGSPSSASITSPESSATVSVAATVRAGAVRARSRAPSAGRCRSKRGAGLLGLGDGGKSARLSSSTGAPASSSRGFRAACPDWSWR